MPDTLPILKKIRVAVKRLIARLLAGFFVSLGAYAYKTNSERAAVRYGRSFCYVQPPNHRPLLHPISHTTADLAVDTAISS